MGKLRSNNNHSVNARILLKKLIDDSEYNVTKFGKAMGFADGSPVSKFISGKVNWSYKNICTAAKLLDVASIVLMDDIGDTIIKQKEIFQFKDSTVEILLQSKNLSCAIVKLKYHKAGYFGKETIKIFCEAKCFCSIHVFSGKMLVNGIKRKHYTVYDDPGVELKFMTGTEITLAFSNISKEIYQHFEKVLSQNSISLKNNI